MNKTKSRLRLQSAFGEGEGSIFQSQEIIGGNFKEFCKADERIPLDVAFALFPTETDAAPTPIRCLSAAMDKPLSRRNSFSLSANFLMSLLYSENGTKILDIPKVE